MNCSYRSLWNDNTGSGTATRHAQFALKGLAVSLMLAFSVGSHATEVCPVPPVEPIIPVIPVVPVNTPHEMFAIEVGNHVPPPTLDNMTPWMLTVVHGETPAQLVSLAPSPVVPPVAPVATVEEVPPVYVPPPRSRKQDRN